MFSRGALNGADINGFLINGGNFVQEAGGSGAVTSGATLKLTRRLVIKAENGVTTTATARLVVRGIRLKDAVTTSASASAIRRLVAKAAEDAAAAGTVNATRRVVSRIDDTASTSAALRFSVRYSALTKLNRVMRVAGQRSMRVPAPAAGMAVARADGPMIVPASAGEMP